MKQKLSEPKGGIGNAIVIIKTLVFFVFFLRQFYSVAQTDLKLDTILLSQLLKC